MSGEMRIAKYISRCGFCSRREAERLIDDGRVTLNGEVIDSPVQMVDESDEIIINGKRITPANAPTLWRYHKPVGLITSHDDPEGRPTVFDHLPAGLPQHIISVGRLDLNSEGLLLLTNHGGIARFLEHPDNGWGRCYRVRMFGTPSADTIRALKKGVEVEGVQYRGIKVELEPGEQSNRWAKVTLTEGKNREIRRVFEHFGHPVSRLIRISYGPFQLGNLAEGEISEVSSKALKNAIGDKVDL